MIKGYLITYNTLSAFFWGCVLVRLLVLYPLVGPKFVAGGMAEFTRNVQTAALLEAVHSALGLVKSPIVTTVMQIASRLLLVWGVVDRFPEVAQSPIYSTMVFAWSVTEVIRYSYYALNLARGSVPKAIVWLRYNAFFVLYPLGAGSEVLLAYFALDDAQAFDPRYALFLKAVLLIYIPGFYVMYTHMIKQRRRVMKNLGKRPVKQE
ncbi:very-long-chain (3R)-3-hydroxyacyl-CoA dehydratase Phs1p [Trichomonascus vanleenenianus]|uniref:protein tyrosine phosphatase-like domain-containing protein n=1 Tax=Trichomonascus vanleenenianus TaxID=2268995 RepID=UPI003ECB1F68